MSLLKTNTKIQRIKLYMILATIFDIELYMTYISESKLKILALIIIYSIDILVASEIIGMLMLLYVLGMIVWNKTHRNKVKIRKHIGDLIEIAIILIILKLISGLYSYIIEYNMEILAISMIIFIPEIICIVKRVLKCIEHNRINRQTNIRS